MKKRQYRSNQGRSPFREEQSMLVIQVCVIIALMLSFSLLILKISEC
jgi:hypothetical protein